MKNRLAIDQIEGIDIEMSNACNLKCPLCLSQLKQTAAQFRSSNVDVDKLVNLLDRMNNLQLVSIAGDASEPTLHPKLHQLLDYLKTRANVFVELYTNGTTHDEDYWTELSQHFLKNSRVQFTICGSTQDLHSKYRVGSNLDVVLRNALAFKKSSPFQNDSMQYICFEYNKNDDHDSIMAILRQFSDYSFINTDPVYERFNQVEEPNGICSRKVFAFMYIQKMKYLRAKTKYDIDCYSYRKKYVRIDNNLKISPCVCYRIHNDEDFMQNDVMCYDEILQGRFKFCLECDVEMKRFLENNDRDAFYMC